ncbi:cell wall-binding repeat-containing protein [Finegoldia magna]|uniref:cell wall-binding repeat-containing protein n=1 Tax=Finegoldia magna TaxID=1260 RepID=UPI000B91991A|nr:cell wall-binding repeat-containing protein [Finegoldia magna]MDU2218821.1 cell wall-binding repeat-containing protein [Finegoldia magna]MDU4278085.1 cell wall-binding repeat-containing protein [Finegoldia magna]MDU6552076.1 cell wall-binding repeat-containing protein [Finegoldia magna]OXZ35916.1 N-acetylmuramoyl-L-alanine amidase [Finegoldia magna]
MKNLKEIAKVSFVALSVSLMISTGSMAQTENDKKDVENELSAKYTSISTHNQSKLTKKAKLGYANVDNLQNEKKENDDLNREDLKSTDLNKHIKEKEEKTEVSDSTKDQEESEKVVAPEKSVSKENSEEQSSEEKEQETDGKESEDSEVKALNSAGQIIPTRIAGKNRYESAAKISREQFTNAKKVIVVNAQKYADALSATTLSDGKYSILYTEKDSLPTATRNEIQRLNPVEVYLLGGQQSISAGIENILKKYSNKVTRIAGRDRYETSAKVAAMSKKKNVVIASGENFSDPLYASSYAYSNNAKILLSSGKTLSRETRDYLLRNKSSIGKVTVVGGGQSISSATVRYIQSVTGKNVSRISGRNRYDGSVKVANSMKKDKVFIASGEDFADALAISPLAQKLNAPILLSSKGKLDTSVIAFLNNFKNSIKDVFIVGGYRTIDNNVYGTVQNVLKKQIAKPKPQPKPQPKPKPPVVKDQSDIIEEDKAIGLHDFVVAKHATTLYNAANSSAKSVRNINTSTVMQVINILDNGWMQLDINGFKGYAKVSDFGMFNPNKYRLVFQQGADLSKFNRNVNMKLAKQNGMDFVILKAGSGYSGEDPKFQQNYNNAKAAGLNVGAYWYSYAVNVEEAKEEAVRFMKILGKKQFEYPVYLDFEDPSQRKIPKKTKTDMAIAFMSILEKNGFYTGLYSSGSWINNQFERERLKDYDIWIAHWHVTSPNCFTPDYGMWQFTNKSKIKGVPDTGEGGVDMNYSYKNYPKIIKDAKLNNF